MERRRNRRMCAVLLAGALTLSGCGSKHAVVNYQVPDEEATMITFFGNKYEPENVIVIEEIISSFMDENPDIRVSYESIKGNEYYEALDKRMKAGKGDDVFMVNHDVLLELEAKGQVLDLSGLSTIPNYTELMRSQMEENGKIYWVPTTVSVFGLYCNLDLLKEHKQKIPENLSEWRNVCQYFSEKGITPVIANNDISLKTLAIGRGFFDIYQEGSQEAVFEQMNQGEVPMSSYLKDGFLTVKEFIDSGYIDTDKALITKKTSDDLQEFVKGESPFMLTGAWAAGRVEEMKPDFKFEVVPYPALEDGQLVVINADTRLSVNAGSEHPEAALRFVEYFTHEENIRKFADQQSSFSPLKGGNPSTVQAVQPLIPCYQSGRTVIGTDGLLRFPIWELTKEVSRQLLAGESLESALKWMDLEAAKGGNGS